jgi:tRNA (guanine-N7-)-methyltransferase
MTHAPDSASVPVSAPASTPSDTPPHPHRPIRSFVLRTGRTTVGQAKALDDLGPQFVLPYQPTAMDLGAARAMIQRAGGQNTSQNTIQPITQTIFEIGFGMGEATAHIAKLMPHALYIGCEVHPPGVGALLKRIGDEHIGNIRIIQHDAVEVLTHMLPPASLDGVHIFFPDPWHKKRHNKRRLIQPPLVTLLASRIKPGGYLHCATDWQHYAEQILQVLGDEPTLANTAAPGGEGYAPKPNYRPLTKFENRGIKLGHGVWDLVFRKV